MIDVEKVSGSLVISVTESRVDMVVARKFRELLTQKITDKPPIVVLDLEKVDYFDSSALGAIVAFMKEIKNYQGVLRLCNLNRSIMTLLKLSKLDLLFVIFETREEAIDGRR